MNNQNSVQKDSDELIRFDLNYIIGIIIRRRRLILWTGAIVTSLVLLYCITAPLLGIAYYTATAQILVDQQRAQVFKSDNSITGEITFDNASIESQVANIESERVVAPVVKKLNLLHDAEFGESAALNPVALVKRVLSPVLTFLGLANAPTEKQLIRAVVDNITQKHLKASRVGLSYAIEISVSAWAPDKAALIANEIAKSYLDDQIARKTESMQHASEQLKKQLVELRKQAYAAEVKVLEFKSKNDLVDVGGTLLSDQQLAEVSSQLSVAIADTAEKEARLKRFHSLDHSDIPDTNLTDALKNEVITKLRNEYLDASRKQSEWAQRYGINHGAAIKLRQQMAEGRKSIFDELRRIGQGYQSDYEIALSRQKTLQDRVNAVFKQTAGLRSLQVKLRDLEATAQSYRNLHDSMLNRLNLAIQQQATAEPDAKIISTASPPQSKSWPKTGLLTAAGALLGMAFGCGVAFLREYFDTSIRTPSEVLRFIRADYIGMLPKVETGSPAGNAMTPHVAMPPAAGDRVIRHTDPVLAYVIDEPFSRFAETIRGIRISVRQPDASRKTRIVGVISTLAGEGKSTVAVNLARLTAQVGDKVLLVDGDLRASTLSKRLVPDAPSGLAEVLMTGKFDQALSYDSISTMTFLPASAAGAKLNNTNEILGSEAMKQFLDAAAKAYDYVILDLPPLDLVVDVRAAAHLIDSFVFVIHSGVTPSGRIEHVLASFPTIVSKIEAVVVNQVDIDSLSAEEKRILGQAIKHGYYAH